MSGFLKGIGQGLFDGVKQQMTEQFQVVGGVYLRNIATSFISSGGNIMKGYRPTQWGGTALGTLQAVFVRSNIGGLFFDAIMNESTETSLTVTNHPTQLGANISDHAFMNPTRISMEVMMSDAMASFIPGIYGEGFGDTKSTNAYKLLLEMQKLRLPLRVVTRRATYNNMLIESISLNDDASTRYGLKASVQMVEIFTATISTEKVSARKWVSGTKTNRGDVQGVEKGRTSVLVGGFGMKGTKDGLL